MIPFTRRAARHVDDLIAYYLDHERPEAARNLLDALTDASNRIEGAPDSGLPAPRPYPQLMRPNLLWLKEQRYWVGYRRTPSIVIVAVFYEAADIPRRF